MESAVAEAAPRAPADRVAGFDLLRGVCALAVAAYHLLHWSGMADLHTWGTYGVYIFFALSGASMYVAYAPRFARGYSPGRFLALRLVRLMPLYLLAMLALWYLQSTAGVTLDADKLLRGFLNVFFLFGLGATAQAEVVGGWSLGVEFVFYLAFPVALALAAGKRWWLVLLVAFFSQHAYQNLLGGDPLTQPLGFVFYFAAGLVVGRGLLDGVLRPHALAALALVACVGALAMTNRGRMEDNLAGVTGIVLSLLAAGAVAASASLRLGRIGHAMADALGKSSYGVYLLHPLLYMGISRYREPTAAVVAAVLVLSFVVALLLERWFERPLQNLAKKRLAGIRAAAPASARNPA